MGITDRLQSHVLFRKNPANYGSIQEFFIVNMQKAKTGDL